MVENLEKPDPACAKRPHIPLLTCKYLCGYLNNDVIQPLCVNLPQMNGYVKYLTMVGKICHLLQMMKKFMKSIMKYGK